MNFNMDYIAHNNELSTFNSYYKLAISIFTIIFTLIVNNLVLDGIIIVLMAFLIMGIAKVSAKNYFKFISIPLVFTVVTSLYLALFTGGGAVIYNTHIFGIVITNNSLNLAIYTFFRVFACFSALGFLALTTPIAEILHCLSSLKVPKIIIEIALLMYNSIFIFLDELDIMRHAQESRLGYNGSKAAYRSLGSLFANLFIKSLDKSEKLQNALDSRAYTGEIPLYRPSQVENEYKISANIDPVRGIEW